MTYVTLFKAVLAAVLAYDGLALGVDAGRHVPEPMVGALVAFFAWLAADAGASVWDAAVEDE